MSATLSEAITTEPVRGEALRRFLRDRQGMIGLVIVLAFVGSALAAPLLAPYAPNQIDIRNRMQGPSLLHWLGTDQLGRDILSRVIYGGRIALSIAVISIGVSLSLGLALGIVAGYGPRWLDNAMVRDEKLAVSVTAYADIWSDVGIFQASADVRPGVDPKVAAARLDALIAEGVATVEVKSGYGLDRETELRMLRAARALAARRPVTIRTTFLGAHAVPAEYAGRADTYIDEICIPTLRAAHAEGLVDAVDGFCEGIAFSPAQIARVFDVARALGLQVTVEPLSGRLHPGNVLLRATRGN